MDYEVYPGTGHVLHKVAEVRRPHRHRKRLAADDTRRVALSQALDDVQLHRRQHSEATSIGA